MLLFFLTANMTELQPISASSIDFSHVDVGNLSTEAIENIEESELDQYLPLIGPNATYHVNYPQETSNDSPVNAVYTWSNKYVSTHSSTKSNAKYSEAGGESFENFSNAIGIGFNRAEDCNLSPPTSYDSCTIANQMYSYTSCSSFQNHSHQYNGVLQWPYS